MPLTDEEIEQIRTDAAAGTINPLVANLSTVGLTIRTQADETAYANTLRRDTITARDKELYDTFEAGIEAATTVKKQVGEKATDYLARAVTQLNTELQTLRDKKDDGAASTKEKERITELEGLLEAKDEEVKKANTATTEKIRDMKVSGEVRSATAAISAKLVKTLTGDAKDDVVAARVAKFRGEYTPELEGEGDDEKVVWKKKDGSYANASSGKRLTTEEVMAEVFGSYIDKGPKQNGAGTNEKVKNPPASGKPDATAYTPGADVKTQGDLMKDLKAAGFLKGTKEFTDLYAANKEGLPLK